MSSASTVVASRRRDPAVHPLGVRRHRPPSSGWRLASCHGRAILNGQQRSEPATIVSGHQSTNDQVMVRKCGATGRPARSEHHLPKLRTRVRFPSSALIPPGRCVAKGEIVVSFRSPEKLKSWALTADTPSNCTRPHRDAAADNHGWIAIETRSVLCLLHGCCTNSSAQSFTELSRRTGSRGSGPSGRGTGRCLRRTPKRGRRSPTTAPSTRAPQGAPEPWAWHRRGPARSTG